MPPPLVRFLLERSTHLVVLSAWFFATAGHQPLAAAPHELGRPLLRGFPPGKAGISHLCQALTQDADGLIYLGNGSVLCFYDGDAWRRIGLPTEAAGIRKFARTDEGTIYAGGAGVLGWIRPTGDRREFVSLADQLPPADRDFEDVFDVLAVGDTVYFATAKKILIWRAGRFAAVPGFTPAPARGARLHRVGDAVYVTALDHPLCRLVDARLEVVADDFRLRQNDLLSVEAGRNQELVLLTAEQGFLRLSAGLVSVLPVEGNRWLAGKRVISALRLPDGSLVVAFASVSGDGGLRFDGDGAYLGPLDQSIGLFVNTIRAFLSDHEGGLWLGTETGLIRLEWSSAVTVFDAVTGLGQGTVTDVVRHEGVLYATTTEGLFQLTPGDATGRAARFARIADLPASSLGIPLAWLRGANPAGGAPAIGLPWGGGGLGQTPDSWPTGGLAPGFASRGANAAKVWPADLVGNRRPTGGGAARWRTSPAGIERVAEPGRPSRRLPRLVEAAVGAVTILREEGSGEEAVLWVGGEKGLVRVAEARTFPPPVPFAVRLTTADVHEGDHLAPGPTLRFDYLALRHQLTDAVTYQTRLAGFERAWSAWSPERTRTFTHLSAGHYRFEVRARDADLRLGAPAALGFAVRAAWWLTGWAWLGYAAAGAGGVAGLVWLRTRALQRRADYLEGLVATRTAELAERNTELVRLNQLELDEKISARLAEEKARLEVLRYQLNPHFLYNTLASISSALPSGRSTARTMVERLADFCRLTLHRSDDRDWTTLGQEMKLLRAYLEIEQSRWGDLLDVHLACDPALADERLPHFLLLPLVENALKYGRATSPDRVGLRLATRRGADGALVVEVANTGEWIEPAAMKTVSSLGLGLENLRERLVRYYPRAHRLEITPTDGWVTVTLHILPPRAG